MSTTEIFFWSLVLVLLYAYVGYGLIIALTVKLGGGYKSRFAPAVENARPPSLIFIIMAYNEEDFIAEKLRNTLALDYPADRISILVNADGSTDNTMQIVARFNTVRLLQLSERKGKAAAMNRSIDQAGEAEILVFSDANTMLRRDALMKLVGGFQDPMVGAVSGEKKVMAGDHGQAQAVGESVYWTYESLWKTWDARFHTLVGAAGELLALRRSLYMPIPEDFVLDDLFLSLHICRQGYRVDYEPEAVSIEGPSASLREEWTRKVRIAAGAFQAFALFAGMLLPWPDGRLAFQFFSRRVLRWVVCPLLLPILLVLNCSLAMRQGAHETMYQLLLAMHLLVYLLALVGLLIEKADKAAPRMLQLPLYFLFMHYSLWAGCLRWMRGKQTPAWQKAKRAGMAV